MKLPRFSRADQVDLFVPDGCSAGEALRRTTHLGVGAHADDLEFMCWHGILACYRQRPKWFTGVTVTDGAGSSRSGIYAGMEGEELVRVRLREQRSAAQVGEYSAVVSLMYGSEEARTLARAELIGDLTEILAVTRPSVLYTHNLLDKHSTHIAVATALVEAVRQCPELDLSGFYGCEVWRGLDWVPDERKVAFDVSAHPALTRSLLGVFDSQIAGGKRYDLATVGRKRANATYFSAYRSDQVSYQEYALDMMPLVRNPSLSYRDYVIPLLEEFRSEVLGALESY